jgi:peptidyl-dipeptidase Dcp
LEKAKLFGFDCYANYSLEPTMAKNSANATKMMMSVWKYAVEKAKKEAADLQTMMDKEGKGEKLEAWDWPYYTDKLRAERYNLSEDEIKPYFKLENVRNGAFECAHRLYGITITPLKNVPVYESDVNAFEVKDADGSHLAVLYLDYYPRAGKRGGAWMSNYREESKGVRPVICNVASFTKPVGDTPSLLTIDEVETLFHEFGHALHGMLTKCNYAGVSGTNVSRDFVELFSQINEHWATAPEVLKMYAKNYKTGETIPDSLVNKILAQKTFNQGFITTELLAASLLDMNLHSLKTMDGYDVIGYEKKAMSDIGLIPQIDPRYRTTYFNHIVGGYDAGYYSYIWSNVLDCDAFEVFAQNGIFDKKTADRFRHEMLERGDSDDPMTLYKNFRGSEPQLDPLLKARGMK